MATATTKRKKNPKRVVLPVGKFVPVKAIRKNANGTYTIKVAAKGVVRNPHSVTKRKAKGRRR